MPERVKMAKLPVGIKTKLSDKTAANGLRGYSEFDQPSIDNPFEDGSVKFEGTISGIRFRNAENLYTVFELNINNEDELTCTAYLPAATVGEHVSVSGRFVVHPVYGKQLAVNSCVSVKPSTREGIIKYLSSGVIKGIGVRMANRIVKKFGDDSIRVLEEFPEKLAEIRGISLERAMGIQAVFVEQVELRKAMLFLTNYGITPSLSKKIYDKYKENTYSVINANPYILADELFGVGFKTADSIAKNAGIPIDSPYRIRSGIKFALSESTYNGHVYLPKNELIMLSADLLNVDPELCGNSLMELALERVIVAERMKQLDLDEDRSNGIIYYQNDDMPFDENKSTIGNGGSTAVYLNAFYNSECYAARKLTDLSNHISSAKIDIAAEIKLFEQTSGVHLAKNQIEAVSMAIKCGVLVITGGPGTGKTTTINTIINILKKHDTKIELAAPTGRAAKRMTEATGMEAKTIHRLLGVNMIEDATFRQSFTKNEDKPLETDVVIIDEMSMVDILLFNSLLRAINYGTRLILVGDVDQLPSVGPGNVLKDIINSGCINVVRLSEIFRQAGESAIVTNAHRINRGLYPVINEKDKDFFFMKRNNMDELVETVCDMALRRLPEFLKCNGKQDIQILTPMRKSQIGVYNLNKVLQQRLNPPSPGKREKEFRSIVFREGDKVMQIKNNYNITWQLVDSRGRRIDEGLGIYNGDGGYIEEINDDGSIVTVCFEENGDERKIVQYEYSQLEELELAYAITIHKSQGSEYKAVIIIAHSGPPMLMSRNLLYTAVTRAKQLAIIVGIQETMNRMVDNVREIKRYSGLAERMERISAQ